MNIIEGTTRGGNGTICDDSYDIPPRPKGGPPAPKPKFNEESKMNQMQRNYIRKRVDVILADKMAVTRQKFTTPSKMISNERRISLIRSGKVKLKSDNEIRNNGYYGTQLTQIFDFSKYETKGGVDQKALQAYNKKLRTKANSINDRVMLGDAEEALKMIQEFEDFDV